MAIQFAVVYSMLRQAAISAEGIKKTLRYGIRFAVPNFDLLQTLGTAKNSSDTPSAANNLSRPWSRKYEDLPTLSGFKQISEQQSTIPFAALTTNHSKIMVENRPSMATSSISEYLKRVFFPEREIDGDFRADTPAGNLVIAHELLHRLADQIDSHAAAAPYPQVAQTLHTVASEKYASVAKLKTVIETLGGKIRIVSTEPKAGKNHWDRLNLDLQDQITVDDFLLTLELKAGNNLKIAQIVRELQINQKKHRLILSDLIAIADPQATQT